MPKPTLFQTLTGAPSRSYSSPNDHHSQFVTSSRPTSLRVSPTELSTEIDRPDRQGRRASFRSVGSSGRPDQRTYRGPRRPGSTWSDDAVTNTKGVFHVPTRWNTSSGGMDLGPSLHTEPSRRYANSVSSSLGRQASLSSANTTSTSRELKHLPESPSKSSDLRVPNRSPLPRLRRESQTTGSSLVSQPTTLSSPARSTGSSLLSSPSTNVSESRFLSSGSLTVVPSPYLVRESLPLLSKQVDRPYSC
jgi:hypothetical protein